MRAILMPDRSRGGESRVSEGADRGFHMVCPPEDVMDGGAATGTEGEGDSSAGIPVPDEVPFPDTDARALETRLYTESTPVLRWHAWQWQTDTQAGAQET